MIIPVIGTFLGSVALILCEAIALCNLVSVVISVLAVLFLREVVAWEGSSDIAAFGAGLALVVAALTFFLMKNNARRR